MGRAYPSFSFGSCGGGLAPLREEERPSPDDCSDLSPIPAAAASGIAPAHKPPPTADGGVGPIHHGSWILGKGDTKANIHRHTGMTAKDYIKGG